MATQEQINLYWRYSTFSFLLVLSLSLLSCNLVGGSSDESDLSKEFEDWLISSDEVLDGGPGKDGIPSIDNPEFLPLEQIDFVPDERRIVGIRVGDEVRAYPHQILDWHEIVNDRVNDTLFALTYCPLTGTAIGWNREVGGQVTEFGVSGLLYRNNLVPYDRNTDSRWSQMLMKSVNGPRIGTGIETIDVIETTWKTWKQMYPSSKVLSRNTGFSRNYTTFTYGRSYLTDHSYIIFPVKNRDSRLANKTRVHGIIFDKPAEEEARVRVYVIDEFGEGISIITDQSDGQAFIVAGSSGKDFAVSFENTLPDGTELQMEPEQNALPVIMRDQEGNRWDVFGRAVDGPRSGEQLVPTNSYTGYWFGWADFFPGLEIYQHN